MILTIKENGLRFGVRVGALILNKDKNKIFLQKQKHNLYMFPGGRIEINEKSDDAIKRELKEELGIIKEKVNIKYVVESFINYPKFKYHEIGFYYYIELNDYEFNKYNESNEFDSLDSENDGNSKFLWIDINDLNNYDIQPKVLIEKIQNKSYLVSGVERLISK